MTRARAWANALAVLVVAAALPWHAGAQTTAAPDVTLTLPQARELAARALVERKPLIAAELAGGLLQANPESSYAYFILAHANAQSGKARAARRAAARSYRFGVDRPERFRAAELAAKLAYADESPTAAQLWLRRAAQNAANDQVETQLGRDFRRVRAENPFSFSLRGALRPSSNVNNGSDTALQIIDGLPVTGFLSGSAQALSGTIANADATLGYRLRGTAKSRTEISARLFVARVALSGEAKDLSPTSRNSDFGSTFGSVTLSHSFALGKAGNSAQVSGSYGQLWSGGDRLYDFTRLDGSRLWRLNDANTLELAVSLEDRTFTRSTASDSVAAGLTATYSHARPSGNSLSFSLNLLNTNSASVNSKSQSVSLRARYALAQKIGPAQVSAGVVLGATDYEQFFAVPIFLTDGRQDTSAFADLNLFFDDLDYAGFAPAVTLRAGRRSSNISRFDTREFSVSVGIASKF